MDSELEAKVLPPPPISPWELLPGGPRSQSGIAVRSYCLGIVLGVTLLITSQNLTAYVTPFLLSRPRLWRLSAFLCSLALFHFLEFWTHARYNLPQATIETFLLFDNGIEYEIAHGTAMIETVITSLFFPEWQSWSSGSKIQLIGVGMMVVGQIIRTTAMMHAGPNFHHKVQIRKRKGHNLVQHGIYSKFRHPSYFGFFWWALGTQVMLGNKFCLGAYFLVLHVFFSTRIAKEEEFLVDFFGDEYVQYKKKTWVGIPFYKTRLFAVGGRKLQHQLDPQGR
ncbi:isoprenylcysteine carboxyl methyltransferase [Aulographum hederae CBS 113979]|uniref:Protein-S-isoprenylcysteine O-methyltransferase n=1 Tax=Aulographum hederae CBS 113979 TaxID=1176131 RepID=A0A6G1GQM6_9PEZI|nr:isoprenylcysteine carboxyl methyltransferase [Aulographum hederae CBS 113979]